MSRYEITDDGKLIRIGCPDGCMETLRPTEPDVGVYLDDIVIAAIRQQQSDLAALKELLAGEMEANEAFRKSGGALDGEDMPTFCARIIAEAEIGREWLKDSSLAKWFPLTAERVDEDAQEIAKLRARLAAVDAAPTVATVCIAPSSDFQILKYSRYDIPQINGTELIARPAKDGGA